MGSSFLEKTINVVNIEDKLEPSFIIGNNYEMQEIADLVERVKAIDSTVLIMGESGTGKSLLAKYIHKKGENKNYPFVHINCASLPANLIESELFGHERGAFTGAISTKIGKFEKAGKGTVFLDEISSLTPELQAKLLVALEERTFERVGGTKSIPLSARIVAATNADLDTAVAKKEFREDLFYRLNVIPITLPPLRYNKENIEVFMNYFLHKFQKKFNRTAIKISYNVLGALKCYDWPGNVRELENTIERAIAICKTSTITLEDLPLKIKERITAQGKEIESAIFTKNSLGDSERTVILEALRQNFGHREKTAIFLGISRRTLQNKLKKYNILTDPLK